MFDNWIILSNLDPIVTEKVLFRLLTFCGKVEHLSIVSDGTLSLAFVKFHHDLLALEAVNLLNHGKLASMKIYTHFGFDPLRQSTDTTVAKPYVEDDPESEDIVIMRPKLDEMPIIVQTLNTLVKFISKPGDSDLDSLSEYLLQIDPFRYAFLSSGHYLYYYYCWKVASECNSQLGVSSTSQHSRFKLFGNSIWWRPIDLAEKPPAKTCEISESMRQNFRSHVKRTMDSKGDTSDLVYELCGLLISLSRFNVHTFFRLFVETLSNEGRHVLLVYTLVLVDNSISGSPLLADDPRLELILFETRKWLPRTYFYALNRFSHLSPATFPDLITRLSKCRRSLSSTSLNFVLEKTVELRREFLKV
ncbi:hypothetical protein GEMRC1_006031 [Eukaryota sp. GEM-RC1]